MPALGDLQRGLRRSSIAVLGLSAAIHAVRVHTKTERPGLASRAILGTLVAHQQVYEVEIGPASRCTASRVLPIPGLRATACTTAPAGLRMAQFEASKRKFRVNVGGRSAEAMARLLHSDRNGRGDLARPAVCCRFARCGLLDRRASIGDPHVL